MSWKAFLCLSFLMAPALGLFGQVNKDQRPVVLISPFENKSNTDISQSLQSSLVTAAASAFRKSGFSVEVEAPKKDRPAKVDFELKGFFAVQADRLVFQTSLTHLNTGRVVASDMASVFAGLTSLDLIDEVITGMAQKAQVYLKTTALKKGQAIPLPEPLVFLSADEGAELSWAGGEVIGKIVAGKVEAPFYPFPSDGTLVVSISKPGFIPKTQVYALTEETREMTIPPMVKEVTQEVGVSTGFGRLLGLGAAYRFYPVPNQVYLMAENNLYLQYTGQKGSKPVTHNDIWLLAGVYLFTPPESDFRFSVQIGAGSFFTLVGEPPKVFIDLVIVPIDLVFEFKVFGQTSFAELRFPYSIGFDQGLLAQNWVNIWDKIPILNLGVLWRI